MISFTAAKTLSYVLTKAYHIRVYLIVLWLVSCVYTNTISSPITQIVQQLGNSAYPYFFFFWKRRKKVKFCFRPQKRTIMFNLKENYKVVEEVTYNGSIFSSLIYLLRQLICLTLSWLQTFRQLKQIITKIDRKSKTYFLLTITKYIHLEEIL